MKPLYSLLTLVGGARVGDGRLAIGRGRRSAPARKTVAARGHLQIQREATPEDIQKVVTAFAALPKQINTIVDFEWGTDVGVENLSQGFTHCFLVTFRSAEARDAYLPHPAHKKFVELVKPLLEKPFVIDYWTQH